MTQPTPWVLAADNDPRLLTLLRSDPSIASSQDNHGYSIPHAAAAYNQLELLRTLVNEFHVDVNIKDEDGETPLFVVETVEAAHVLVEELKIDTGAKNDEGMTAEEKIRSEGDFTTIADYLKECCRGTTSQPALPDATIPASSNASPAPGHVPRLPPNVKMRLGTLEDEDAHGNVSEVDPEFRRRIEELASMDDFRGDEAQDQLKGLVTDAIRGAGRPESERETRQRLH
ncbi:hypothetical protein MMC21_001566 [Puttea exsequens]|nr:hypothetical protein [Puttea exsequens]